MRFWKELTFVVVTAALVICIVFLGIKSLQLEDSIAETGQSLEGEKVELHDEIVNSYADLETKLDEDKAEVLQYLEEEIGKLNIGIIDGYADIETQLNEDIAGVLQYLDEAKLELHNEIVNGYADLEDKTNEDLAGVMQYIDDQITGVFDYLGEEIGNIYNAVVATSDEYKDYTDTRVRLLEILINLICQVNGLRLPPGYTPPEF
jgi:hypothetical protein